MTQPTLILGYYADSFINTPELTKHYAIVHATAEVDLADQAGSMTANVNAVIAAINAHPGPFALAGLAYGAWVMSKVYDEIRSGSLTSRRSDFMGAAVAGNPMREAGHTFPGCPDPGGHGIASTNLVGSETLWWEFARPADAISVNLDDTGGDLEQAVFAWANQEYTGAWDDVKDAAHAAFSGHPLQTIDSIIRASASGLFWLYSDLTWATYQPIDGDNRTVYKIATDYLTSLAPAFTATTVITVDGSSDAQDMRRKLGGWATDQGTVLQPFPYSDWRAFPQSSGFDATVDSLNELIVNTPAPGKIVLFGCGNGSVLIGSWLARYGPASTVGPDRLSVILIANPSRNYGGVLRETGAATVPADTRYTVLDLKRQYDGWSDWPDRSAVLTDLADETWDNIIQTLAGVGTLAGQNAALGMVTIHDDYDGIDVPSDEFYEKTLGNITYRVYTTYPMPLTKVRYPLSQFIPSFISSRDAELRPQVELKYDRIEGTPKLEPAGGITSIEEAAALWAVVEDQRRLDELQRLKEPQIRLWDGDGVLRGEVHGWRDIDYEWIENDTGTAALQLSLDHYLAQWVMNFRGRQKRNVLITVDKNGDRWSGFMDNFKVVNTRGDDRYITITFKHDYEQTKHILCWSNPFLLPEVQFPKLWVIFGPAKWCLLVTMLVNLMRLESSLWTLPDNPLDIKEWMDFDISTWRNVVKPFEFLSDTSNLTIIFSRFKSLHDTWKKDLEDAQLTVVCRRYIKNEDPHPFSDLAGPLLGLDISEDLFSLIPLRHFCLVWDIQDKSGWGTETAFGGSLLTGLRRAVVNLADDGLTEGIDLFVGDPTYPGEYYHPGWAGSRPQAPHVVYEDGEYTGISESEFTFFEATDTSFVTGGHSMPGVNEAFSAGINMAGDFLTSLINTWISLAGAVDVDGGFGGGAGVSIPSVDIPPLGGLMDAVAKILYEDTFLAFMEIPTLRASPLGIFLPIAGMEDFGTSLGDFHFYEGWGDGADRAFTLAALMAVRAKWWATRAHTVHTIKVCDAAPYRFGEAPYGHFGIGDRIGTTFTEWPIPHTIFVERVKKAKYGWGKDGSRGWTLEVGYQEPQDPALKALDWIRDINSAFGVLGIL